MRFAEMITFGWNMAGAITEAGIFFEQNTGPQYPTITRRCFLPNMYSDIPLTIFHNFTLPVSSSHFHSGFRYYNFQITLTQEGPDLGEKKYNIGPGLRFISQWTRDMISESAPIKHEFSFPLFISTARDYKRDQDLPFQADWGCGQWYPISRICKTLSVRLWWPSAIKDDMPQNEETTNAHKKVTFATESS